MPIHTREFRSLIEDVLRAADPRPVSLDQLYAAAKERFDFDSRDLTEPTHFGEPVGEPSWKRNLRNVLQHGKQGGTLVNEKRNSWRLPTPDPARTLDVTTAWQSVRDTAEAARDAGSELRSTQRGQRYRIGKVDAGKIVVIRLDSPASTSISRGEVERAVVHLNAAGGTLARTTLNNTVAKEVAIVGLHPQLRWDEGTDSVVVDLHTAPPRPEYTDFGEAPNDDLTQLSQFARRVRRGQPKFRENLLRLYGGRCAVSGWGPGGVLEAAHIDLHARSGNNRAENGILLRSDLHLLFDCGQLRIHPESLQVVLSDDLRETPYWAYHGTRLRDRIDGSAPNRESLRKRWESPAES